MAIMETGWSWRDASFPQTMISYRCANAGDVEAIRRLLEALSLVRPDFITDRFCVACDGDRVVGVAHVEDAGQAVFVSSVGVEACRQGRGIASGLLRWIARRCQRDLYLYTIIPDFFARLGFESVSTPEFLPQRALFGCETCEPDQCVCMLRRFHDS